jgi:hypothetical protein
MSDNYYCKICSKQYSNKQNFFTHVKSDKHLLEFLRFNNDDTTLKLLDEKYERIKDLNAQIEKLLKTPKRTKNRNLDIPKNLTMEEEEETNNIGYIYCFSNLCMPGIIKCGMTYRTPEDRLKEANASDTFRPPIPYKLEFAKKVKNPRSKEKILHKLLEKYTKKLHPKREFFNISPKDLQLFFDLIDGEMYNKTLIKDDEIFKDYETLKIGSEINDDDINDDNINDDEINDDDINDDIDDDDDEKLYDLINNLIDKNKNKFNNKK